jgi:hypothetical protein
LIQSAAAFYLLRLIISKNRKAMTIKTILFLLIATFIVGCQPNNDYNVNYDGDKLVVNGVIEGNVGITVALSKSQSPAGIIPDAGFNVKNGRVWLYQNDTFVSEMTLNTFGKYSINGFKPQVGKFYRLKAVAKDLDTVESLPVVMPDVPTVSSYILKKDSSYAVNQGRGAAFFSVTLKDNVSEKNFYFLDSYIQINRDSVDSFLYGYTSNLEACEFSNSLFTDKCFNGSDFTFGYFAEHTNRGVLKIELTSIDKNLYNYYRNQDQPKGLELGFVEPKLAVSNMKNGYGIFAAKNTRTFSLKLD